jgi:hypothetical protein
MAREGPAPTLRRKRLFSERGGISTPAPGTRHGESADIERRRRDQLVCAPTSFNHSQKYLHSAGINRGASLGYRPDRGPVQALVPELAPIGLDCGRFGAIRWSVGGQSRATEALASTRKRHSRRLSGMGGVYDALGRTLAAARRLPTGNQPPAELSLRAKRASLAAGIASCGLRASRRALSRSALHTRVRRQELRQVGRAAGRCHRYALPGEALRPVVRWRAQSADSGGRSASTSISSSK